MDVSEQPASPAERTFNIDGGSCEMEAVSSRSKAPSGGAHIPGIER